jgi:hypothetical protein
LRTRLCPCRPVLHHFPPHTLCRESSEMHTGADTRTRTTADGRQRHPMSLAGVRCRPVHVWPLVAMLFIYISLVTSEADTAVCDNVLVCPFFCQKPVQVICLFFPQVVCFLLSGDYSLYTLEASLPDVHCRRLFPDCGYCSLQGQGLLRAHPWLPTLIVTQKRQA